MDWLKKIFDPSNLISLNYVVGIVLFLVGLWFRDVTVLVGVAAFFTMTAYVLTKYLVDEVEELKGIIIEEEKKQNGEL